MRSQGITPLPPRSRFSRALEFDDGAGDISAAAASDGAVNADHDPADRGMLPDSPGWPTRQRVTTVGTHVCVSHDAVVNDGALALSAAEGAACAGLSYRGDEAVRGARAPAIP